MEPSKLNPMNWSQSAWLKSGAGLAAGTAVAKAFNGDWKAVTVCGAAGLMIGRVVDSLTNRPVQSYTVQSKRTRLKLDLESLQVLDISIPQIKAALKDKLDIQPCEGSEEIKGTQGSVNKWKDKGGNYLAVKIIQPKEINFHWTGTTKGEINSILVPEHPNLITALELLMASADKQFFRIRSQQDIPDLPKGKLHVIAATFQWVKGKDLFEQLAQGQHKDLIPLTINATMDMCKALEHLHNNGYVYRDLKTENIMFDGRQFKLADFGFSKYLGEGSTQTPCGTLEYLSLDAYSAHDKKIDIWTLGVLILDIAINWTPADYPQRVENRETKQEQVKNFFLLPDGLRENYLRHQFTKAFCTCPELLDLVCQILKKPESRPDLKNIESTLLRIQSNLVARNLTKVGNDISNRYGCAKAIPQKAAGK